MSWFGRIKDLGKHIASLNPDEEYMLVKKPKKSPPDKQSGLPGGRRAGGSGLEKEEKSLPKLENEAKDKWFEKKIQSVLKDNAMKRLVPGKKFGDLDHKRLHKIMTSDKLFMRPESIKGKDYHIVFLVDRSGSMYSENKSQWAIKCMHRLLPVLDKYVKTAMIGYHNYTNIVKRFEDKLKKNMSDYDSGLEYQNATTYESYALSEARAMLKKVTGRKIIITLTDGIPDLQSEVRKEIQSAEKERISLIGIGIQSSFIENFYKHNVIVFNLKDLYDGVIRELSKLVRRRV